DPLTGVNYRNEYNVVFSDGVIQSAGGAAAVAAPEPGNLYLIAGGVLLAVARLPRCRRKPTARSLALVLITGLVSLDAGTINAVPPSCASVGAQVTITGIGFDSGTLGIAVGGVAAPAIAVTSTTATFTVPTGVGLGR